MHAILTILGILIVIAALRRLSEVLSVNGLGIIVVFGLGILLVRFWPLFLAGVAVVASLFLWWLFFRFLAERFASRCGKVSVKPGLRSLEENSEARFSRLSY
jgi:hypothetical protein